MSELTAGPIFLIYYSEILCPTHCLGYSRSFSLWNNRKLPKSLERSLELLQSSTVELNCFLIHDMSWVFKLLVINIIPGMTFIICFCSSMHICIYFGQIIFFNFFYVIAIYNISSVNTLSHKQINIFSFFEILFLM